MGLTDSKIFLPQTSITPFGRGAIGDSLLQNLPGDPKVKKIKVNIEDLKLLRPINIDNKSKHIPFSRMVAIILFFFIIYILRIIIPLLCHFTI